MSDLPLVIPSLAAVRYYVGEKLGPSDWIEVSHLTRPMRDLARELPDRELIPALRPPLPAAASVAPGERPSDLSAGSVRSWDITDDDPISLDIYEKKALLRALHTTGGDKLAAARLLNVGKSTLYRKLKRFDIK